MSDNITKRVGLGTAYGFAKAGGYEGTVAEFTELLGNIAIDLARIENLSVTVTTLPAGSQATASLNGSVLSLGIPKGDKGDKGNTGNTPDFGIGTVTTLSAGSSATASITGTAENPVLNLGLPKGADGSLASGVLASTYSASKTYAVGDYVYYSGNLYRCTTAITTAEAWTSGHWTQVTLADDVSDVKSNIAEMSLPIIESSNVKCSLEETSNLFVFKERPSTGFPYAFFNRRKATFSQPNFDPNASWIILCEYENGVLIANMNATAGGCGYYLSYDLSVMTAVSFGAITLRGNEITASVSDDSFSISAGGTTKTFTHEYFTAITDTFVAYRLGYARANNRWQYPCTIKFDIPDFDGHIKGLEWLNNAFYMTALNDGSYINENGEIGTHANFGYTDYIEVPKWANALMFLNKVTMGSDYPLESFEYATYDSTKQFIETVHGDSTIGYITKSIDPSTVSYIRVNYGVNNRLANECMVRFLRLGESQDSTDLWNGKTGDFLGDSLTAQNQFTNKLASLYGINVNNYGVSGTTISNKVASNYFASRVPSMSTSCDFVFVMGGTNDWGLSAPIGTKADTTADTFYGGLYLMFEALRSRFPTKPIFVSTITQRNWTSTADQASGIDSNNNGDSIMDFNEAITYMAHRYGCVVMDGFGESGIVVSNLSTYTADNLHFNATGGTRFAQFIKDHLEQVAPY